MDLDIKKGFSFFTFLTSIKIVYIIGPYIGVHVGQICPAAA